MDMNVQSPATRLRCFAGGRYRYPAYRGKPPAGTPQLQTDILAVLDELVPTSPLEPMRELRTELVKLHAKFPHIDRSDLRFLLLLFDAAEGRVRRREAED